MREDKEGLDRGKVALIYIYRILKKYSDREHPLTQQDIIDRLEKDYSFTMERKAIKRNLLVLEEAGIGIEYLKKGCYLDGRTFKDPELRLLIDSVLCSKHISADQTKKLIKKLSAQSNTYFSSYIKHVYSVEDWNKTDNEAIFYNIELIDKAIEKKKQIHYDYYKFGIDKKLRWSSEQYVSPYQLILHNQRYYLMAYSEYWKNMVYHRLDHISDMTITDRKATPIRDLKGYENGIDNKKFNSQLPYMYADDPRYIKFLADIRIIDQVVDWFGEEARICKIKDDDSRIEVNVKASPLAMKHWALQYLDYVEVLEPKALKDEIKLSIANAAKKYDA